MSVLVSLPTRVKIAYIEFLKANPKKVNERQRAAFERYINDDRILFIMAISFFDQWDNLGRNYAWNRIVKQAIDNIMEANQ